MYKININENILYLEDNQNVAQLKVSPTALISPYSGKSKQLLNFIDMLEKTNRIKEVVIHFHDINVLKKDFKSLFKIIKASGGVVFNEDNHVLMMFRRGYWDLPKGKIDKGEKKKNAALREVNEETGIVNLELIEKIYTSYHTYKTRNKKRVLKKTYWYKMTCPNQIGSPQTEEDIEKLEWADPKEFFTPELKIYKNIVDVLNAAGLNF